MFFSQPQHTPQTEKQQKKETSITFYNLERMPLPLTIRRIVLTGFMGAGKSTIGALLAEKLGWVFVDSDTSIEASAGKTIARIFAEDGEDYFRELETEAIYTQSHYPDLVLALGGGAMENPATRAVLASLPETVIVFLDAPLEVMISRCLAQPGAAERPVLADRERLVQRFTGRLPFYRGAHLTVATENLEPQGVVERILEQIMQNGSEITENSSENTALLAERHLAE
jgi:shikimate kinase